VAKKPLPDYVRKDIASYIGCVSGAIEIEVYKKLLADAGFKGISHSPFSFLACELTCNILDVIFVDTKGDLEVYFMDGGIASDASKSASGALCRTAETCCSKPDPETAQLQAKPCCSPSSQAEVSAEPMIDASKSGDPKPQSRDSPTSANSNASLTSTKPNDWVGV
jgi:arsenite methyltransferase